MDRRQALHQLTLLVGGVISAPAMTAIMSGCRAESPTPDWTPSVLTAQQRELLELLVDGIIPPTGTPGAKDAGVAAFIDTLLDRWVDADERDRFLRGLETVDEEANAAHGVAFRDASAEQQAAVLTNLDQQAAQARAERASPLPFFAVLKEWTLVGYYTSEVGATQELQWLAAPGRYDGDLPLEEVGPTWA
jgi:hypothetical protein